jgi:hypothetical protein
METVLKMTDRFYNVVHIPVPVAADMFIFSEYLSERLMDLAV